VLERRLRAVASSFAAADYDELRQRLAP